MSNSQLSLPTPAHSSVCTFKRRDVLPIREGSLWQIKSGVVRLSTLTEDDKAISLGFWGAGDIFGKPLMGAQIYSTECLTPVKAIVLPSDSDLNRQRAMLYHIHQMEELLKIRQGPIRQRLELLLFWLAGKFGYSTEQGLLIQCRLTQQAIAETIGTTRVTVARLMQQLEHQNIIGYSKRNCIILRQLADFSRIM